MKNRKIRDAARAAKVGLWEVADALGISEPTMTRKLRYELPTNEQEKFLVLIERIAAGRNSGVKVENVCCAILKSFHTIPKNPGGLP